jgi:hypothetical protein
MQAQAMCLEIDLAGCLFEHRPNSRPELCKYNYLYFYLCGFCSAWQHLNLNMYFIATIFKIHEHQFQQRNTTRWDPPPFPNYSTNKNRMQSFVTWPAGSKQKPQGFFYQGKVPKHKSLFITENISSKPKLIYKWFLCYRKKWSHDLLYCGVSLKDWEASDSAWEQHSKWSLNCIYVVHNKGIEFVLHNAQILKTAQGF